MSEFAQSFQEAVKAVVLEKGEVCSEAEHWTYGWKDWDREHYLDMRAGKCLRWSATVDSEVIEYSFSEFMDTFNGNEDKTVLALTHVFCDCGKYRDRTIGYEGSTADLLGELLLVRRETKW